MVKIKCEHGVMELELQGSAAEIGSDFAVIVKGTAEHLKTEDKKLLLAVLCGVKLATEEVKNEGII